MITKTTLSQSQLKSYLESPPIGMYKIKEIGMHNSGIGKGVGLGSWGLAWEVGGWLGKLEYEE